MPANRNALVRYKTIDKCLRNRYKQWTLEDLIEACSDALYDHEGINKGVSKRTIQADIQLMRSDKLGYNAPIIVSNKKYYAYENAEYSITNIPITDQDLDKLNETVEFLKQFKGFSHFTDLDGMVQKLEDHVYSQKTNQASVIDFEKNENLKGLHFLDQLYQSIIKRKCIRITYQSFKARTPNTFEYHPYLLKEFRNRWFVIGAKKTDDNLLNLALDRIMAIEESNTEYIYRFDFDATEFFKHAIGVSVSPNQEPEKALLFVTQKHAPYVLTKPFHASQKLIKQESHGIVISLDVQHNFELEKDILGLGDGIKVIAPQRLRRSIQERLLGGLELYETEIHDSGLKLAKSRLANKGFSILNNVYTTKETKALKKGIENYFKINDEPQVGKRKLLIDIPHLKPLLFNANLNRIIKSIDPKAFLTKAIYFDKSPQSNWYVTWHQDIPINVNKKMNLDGFTGWTEKESVISVCPPIEILKNSFTIRIQLDDANRYNGALQIVPGSHQKQLTDEEISTITKNSLPFLCEISAGGVQLMKPLVLHASSKSKKGKKRRVIHLEFSSTQLPNGLDWLEREESLFTHLNQE